MQKITVSGRLVSGHPMKFDPKIDRDTKKPAFRNGKEVREVFFQLAIPKAEADWKLSAWGQLMVLAATEGYKRGEHQRPDFSFKVNDGDCTIPNRAGTVYAEKDGFPGNWIITCSTQLRAVPTFRRDATMGGALVQLTDPDNLKPGDYISAALAFSPNGTSEKPAQTAGIYVNPEGVCLDREGEAIISEGSFDANAAFGAPVAAPPAPVAPPPAPPVALPPAPPAPDFLQGPKKRLYQGQAYDETMLLSLGWTQAQVDALPTA